MTYCRGATGYLIAASNLPMGKERRLQMTEATLFYLPLTRN